MYKLVKIGNKLNFFYYVRLIVDMLFSNCEQIIYGISLDKYSITIFKIFKNWIFYIYLIYTVIGI